jgi:hypothetical protein
MRSSQICNSEMGTLNKDLRTNGYIILRNIVSLALIRYLHVHGTVSI